MVSLAPCAYLWMLVNVGPLACPNPPEPFDGVYVLDTSTFCIDREVFRKIVQRNELADQARILPYEIKDGSSHGFQIFSVHPDGIYDRLRLQSGDVLQSVNGYPLTSVEEAVRAVQALRDVPELELGLLRGQQCLVLRYLVR